MKTNTPIMTKDLIAQHNLTDEEYQKIVEILGREPNVTELGMFSVMWSEHCSYKSSRVHLKKLPTTGPRVVQEPGENAGAVDIGDGLCVVLQDGIAQPPVVHENRIRARRPVWEEFSATCLRWGCNLRQRHGARIVVAVGNQEEGPAIARTVLADVHLRLVDGIPHRGAANRVDAGDPTLE